MIPILSSLLWRIGGQKNKLFRRIGMPAIAFFCGFMANTPILVNLLSTIAVAIAVCLGYGENLRKQLGKQYHAGVYLIGAIYGFSLLPLYLAAGLLIPGIIAIVMMSVLFGTTMYISHKFNSFDHKYVEFLTGFGFGIAALLVVLL